MGRSGTNGGGKQTQLTGTHCAIRLALVACAVAIISMMSTAATAQNSPDVAAVVARQILLKRAALINAEGRIEYLYAASKIDKDAITTANNTLMKAQAQFRQAHRTQILDTAEKNKGDSAWVKKFLCQRFFRAEAKLRRNFTKRIDNGGRLFAAAKYKLGKAERLGETKGWLRADFLEMVVASEVAGALYPTLECDTRANDRQGSNYVPEEYSGVSATVLQLNRLARLIRRLNPADVAERPGIPKSFIKEMILARQDLMLEEFHRLAEHGLIVDPESFRPIQRPRRDQIHTLILKNFADFLNYGSQTRYFDFLSSWHGFIGPDNEGRATLAAAVQKDIKENLLHRTNSYLTSGLEPEPQRYFRAMALALSAEHGMILGKYDKEYLGDNRWTMGVGQKLRGYNFWYNSDETDAAVKIRMRKALKELAIVAAAFEHAADNTPRALKARHPGAFKLLKEFGYILEFEAEDKSNRFRYHITGSRQGLALNVRRSKDAINLPGATLLDIINPKNIAVTLGSIVIPEIGAARIAALAQGANLSRKGVTAAWMFGDLVIGAGFDAVVEAIERKGRVDFQRLILESVILGSIINVSGSVTKPALDILMQKAARRQRGTALYKAMETFIRNNPEKSAVFYKAILEGFDMGSEAGISLAFQAHVQDQNVDSTALLSLLLNSAMHRAIAKGSYTIADIASGKFGLRSPALNKFFDEFPKARAEAIKNQERLAADLEKKKQLIRDELRYEPNKVTRLFTMLLRGDVSWSEVKQIHGQNEQFFSVHGMQDLADFRRLFIETLVHEVRIKSIDEVNQQNDWRIKKVQDSNLPAQEKAAKLADIKKRRRAEIDLVNADLVAPGSTDPSSDIDRASKSNYVRANLRILFQKQARLFTGNDVDFVASSKSVDVNEYINVFPFIRDNAEVVTALKKHVMRENDSWNCCDKTKPEWPGKVFLSHENALNALAMSGYMAKMDAAQLAHFIANERAMIDKEIKLGLARRVDRRTLELKLDFAKKSLASAEKRLAIYREKMRKKLKLKIDHPSVAVEARDHLYDLRMGEIRELQWELGKLESDKPVDTERALALRAFIERRLTLAMRDGIETFTHPASLDIFVNRGQADRNPDGSKKSVAQRLNDPDFNLKRVLRMYSVHDINGVIHDQAKFILEHINAFNDGHEEAYLTGRAMGKYIERVYLLLKIKGLDIQKVRKLPDYHPTKRLLVIAQKLAELKPYPEQINEYLMKIGRSQPASLANGLAEIFNLVEVVIPGMDGMTGVVPERLAEGFKHKLAPFARPEPLKKEIKRLRELAVAGGGKLTGLYLEGEIKVTKQDIKRYGKELGEMRKLAAQVRLPRINEIRIALRQVNGIRQNLISMPWPNKRSATYSAQLQEQEKLNKRIAEARREKRPDGVDKILENDPASREFRRVKRRLEWLKKHLKWLESSLQTARERAAGEAKFADLNLTGDWLCEGPGPVSWVGRIHHFENDVDMDFWRKEDTRKTVEAIFRSNHRWGKLRGFLTDTQTRTEPLLTQQNEPMLAAQKETNTRTAFRAEVEPDGNQITFTQAAGHPRTTYRWDGAICRRRPDQIAVPVVDFVKLKVTDVPPGRVANEMRDKEGNFKYGRFEISVLSDRGKEPFINKRYPIAGDSYVIMLGRLPVGSLGYYGLMLPGSYRLVVHSGGRVSRKNFTVVAGKKIEVTVLMGRLKITRSTARGPAAGEIIRIYTHDNDKIPVLLYDPRHPSKRKNPNNPVDGFRLPPGRYSVQVGSGGVLSSWLHGVDVKASSVRKISYHLSTITMVFTKPIYKHGVRIRRPTQDDSDSVEWVGVSKNRLKYGDNSVTLTLPPGKYEAEVTSRLGAVTHKFSLGRDEVKSEKVN